MRLQPFSLIRLYSCLRIVRFGSSHLTDKRIACHIKSAARKYDTHNFQIILISPPRDDVHTYTYTHTHDRLVTGLALKIPGLGEYL